MPEARASMHNSKFALLEWLSSCALQAVKLLMLALFQDALMQSVRSGACGSSVLLLQSVASHVCSMQSEVQAVQAMGGSRSLVVAV